MKPNNSVASLVAILSAATSLVLMICLLQMDQIVFGTLYSYGLEFSYSWADQYWMLARIGFAMGWLNITVAFVVQINNVRMKHRVERSSVVVERALETAKIPEKEEAQGETPREPKEEETAEPSEEAPVAPPKSEAEEKKDEPQQPEQIAEQEPQQSETKPEETPSLVDLFQ